MPKFSETELSLMTGHTRATIRKKLDGVKHEKGERNARLYDSKLALECIYLGAKSDQGEVITAAEAARRLTVKKGEQIDLEMEIARKERIPISDIEAVNDRVMQNIAGLLKAHVGKPLDETLIGDLFTELRELGSVLNNG